MLSLLTTLLFLSSTVLVIAGNVTKGGACQLSRVHLDSLSHKLVTDCDATTFCASRISSGPTERSYQVYKADTEQDGICQPRECRNELFPYGYDDDAAVPRLCPYGTFCPDDGSECRPVVSLGGNCEIDRHDQCVVTSANLASTTQSWGQHFSPSVRCLNSTCVEANVTLGEHCILDSTTYIYPGSDDRQVTNTVVKDNCVAGLYCDSSDAVCHRIKSTGESCTRDGECVSYDCYSQICATSANTANYNDLRGFVVMLAMIIFFFSIMAFSLVPWIARQKLQQHFELTRDYQEQLRVRSEMKKLRYIADLHQLR